MYLVFESLFYAGLLLSAVGLFWAAAKLLRRDWSLRLPLVLMLVGIASLMTPMVLTRYWSSIDLGPRNVLVEGERHITLTGWDEDDYRVLEAFPETIVLQMANSDVTDDTLQYIQAMANLRELDLNDTSVTDAGLERLSRMSGLEVLRLRGTGISDDGFTAWIMPMHRLKRLDLRETIVGLDTVNQWRSKSEDRRALR